ncbi:MAG: tRNA preQ1(34) S-adenosylmethionine ribosyltransferase-isomerase QueA [Patescibacteria group bacterium]
MSYTVSDFDYKLPPELIAQKPVKPRDHSRLLLLNKKTGAMEHKHFYDLVDYFKPGDLLVLNNSKVFPARLIGRKAETGGAVEVFLHRKLSDSKASANVWECLIGGRVKERQVVEFLLTSNTNKVIAAGKKTVERKRAGLKAEILKNNQDGTWQVKFNQGGAAFWKTINKIGIVPLPPYIKRNKKVVGDKENYQTVFADEHKVGSAAAPTAGLHFTKGLLKKIKAKGVKIVYVTLHVGLGTFAPVKTEKINEHKMHSEFAEISAATIKAILATKKSGGRIIPVGTTSCRVLESLDWHDGQDGLKSRSLWTDIFIYPSYEFKIIDALITNFHLPKSTLLMLVSALAGKEHINRAYQEAIRRHYRFFSYGDAMFIY